MATRSPNEELCRISKGLYTIAEWMIGPESVVRTRRQVYDAQHILDACCANNDEINLMSGSRAEGFCFDTSDIDVMVINEEVLVIDNELRNISVNITSFRIVLLMETDNVPPGFTLLKCIRYDTTATDKETNNILLPRGDSVYTSSKRAQQISFVMGKSMVHGPCRSGVSYGIEYDYAYTLKCPFWPKHAHSFIHRSILTGWPTSEELTDICKDGCLLVPVSSKKLLISDHSDLEWRISFSLAEKKMVYSMNHCQFLCYGLMKIFLNEVLKELPETKTESGNVLCSYFMKTAVFWEISECVNQWSDIMFLNKFLDVFRRVIKWVAEGYCPNFFIPEHNMFYGKIYGRQQRELMVRLRSLYDDGIMCLYHCSSLSDIIYIMLNDIFQFYQLQVHAVDLLAYQKEQNFIEMIIRANSTNILTDTISALKKKLWCIASLEPKSVEMSSMIKMRIQYLLQQMTFAHAKRGFQIISSNKSQYLFTKTARTILRQTKTSYCLSTIHQAVISYMNGEYHKTIQIVVHIHQRLQYQPYTYIWDMDRDIIMGSRQQGMSYEDIVKRFIIDNYRYNPDISIQELTLESIIWKKNCPDDIILIPPLVFLYFLQILSYTQLNKSVERKEALDELHSVLYHDNNHHIQFRFKAISWEILGICQQLCGDYVGANQSYNNALNDEYNDFKEATIIRIRILSFNSFQDLMQLLSGLNATPFRT